MTCGGRSIRRQLMRTRPPSLQLPHCVCALERPTPDTARPRGRVSAATRSRKNASACSRIHASTRSRRPAPSARLGETPADPALFFPDERLDFRDRGVTRSPCLDAFSLDEQRDGSTPGAHEVVAQDAAGEPHLASAPGLLRLRRDVERQLQLPQGPGHRIAMRLSIHSSTDLFNDPGVWARESIGAPISTVTIPGRLRKALRPQSSPALCATGTTGTPHSTASQAPPT